MIDKTKLTETVEALLADSACYPVEINVTPTNEIEVTIDSDEPVDIDECIRVTRGIEAAFDRDVEDYELQVGSAGLTSPFKVPRQYWKNIGNPVDVLTRDGRKLHGVLTAADDECFTVEVETKVKIEGEKRPKIEMQPITFPYGDVKSVVYHLEF